jgi:hypothetical protein
MGSSSIKKRSFSFIMLLSLHFAVYAQDPALSGRVYDGAKQPVAFADVALLSLPDSLAYKTAYTDEAGHFEIAEAATGNYLLKISAIGYAGYYQELQVTGTLALPDIILPDAPKELDNVTINLRRPIVTRKIDRLEFDVENSILSSDNAWEILKKTPGVSMASGEISIRGSSGILVTINDKKVYLTGTELKNLLENTSGEDIKSIEVITTPPAKYEAQGSAVLNIKMKKNGPKGYKASLSGAYVQTMYPKGVVSTSQYYKNSKLSVYGGYSFGSGHYYGRSNSEVKYFDENGAVASTWKSREQTHYRALSQNSYNLTAEYQLDTLTTVAAGFNGFSSLKSTANIDTPTAIYDGMGQLDSLYHTRNHRDYPQKNSTITGFFERRFNATDKISLSTDITRYYYNQDQQITADFSLPATAPYKQNTIDSDDTRRISLFSVQADYSANKWGSNIEAGFRYGSVNAENDFDYLNEVNGTPVPGMNMSNRFLYNEYIYAGYMGLDRELGKWGLKAGLRGEHTHLEGNSVTLGEVNTQDYFKLFPTFYALYKASDNHQIGASYGKRIVRPQYASLNPFRSYSTPYAYQVGDPRLQPAKAHNFGLNYTLMGKHNFDLYYQYQKDPTLQITYQDYATSTLVSQVTNIKKNTAFGLGYNTNLEIYPWWESGIQAAIGYQEDTYQGFDGNLYANKIWNFTGVANNRFNLAKDKNLLAEANFYYVSPTVQGTNKLSQISSLSLSIKKIFWKGNGELSVILSDIYRGEQNQVTTSYANQYSYSSNYYDTQSFRLQFRYRFGNQKLGEGKTRQTTDEQNRLN